MEWRQRLLGRQLWLKDEGDMSVSVPFIVSSHGETDGF